MGVSEAQRFTRRIRVRGIVQGVGFRPHVWALANALGLSGWVRNDAEGVLVGVCGSDAVLADFVVRLRSEAPPLARIDAIEAGDSAETVADGFHILESAAGEMHTAIGPDTNVCADCLAEMRDPANRRYRYAFTTCTHCGPRYTIARGLPYDRERTSLAPFPLCAACVTEYTNPADRRFHAEATCCPDCGPALRLLDASGDAVGGDPVEATLTSLLAGQIIAIKGLGGFHLACDARNATAVAALRQRKSREEKPFAVMAASAERVASLVALDAESRSLLESKERPVVLVRKHAHVDTELPGVAPGLGWLGVMLPCTPIQHLLFDAAASQTESPVLVMTSANPGGEPLVIDNDEAFARLAGIADAFLIHDRDIVARCDDSVIRVARSGASTARGTGSVAQFMRRARGYTPLAIKLPAAGPAVLAFGGGFKNTICVTRGDEAFVSTHIGDLDNSAVCRFLDETVARMLALTEISPEIVVADRHPDLYASSAAARFAEAHELPLLNVQHHHAHIAAVCAEQGIDEAVIGLALDGVGLGDDGNAWGGELLWVDGARATRVGYLRPLPLPGGDRAAREPWRMGAAALFEMGRGDEIATRFGDEAGAGTVASMLQRGLNTPLTSSAGRLFDAAAGLLGVSSRMSYEGQAAMRLEGLAERHAYAESCAHPEALADGFVIEDNVLDFRPLLASLADDPDVARAAARFHATLALGLTEWLVAEAAHTGTRQVVLGGGCMLNQILLHELRPRLLSAGLVVHEASQVSPGDGGISLGQAWLGILSAHAT